MQKLSVTLGFCGFTVDDLCHIALSKCPVILDKAVSSKLGIESNIVNINNLNHSNSTFPYSNSLFRVYSSLKLERSIRSKSANTDLIKSLLEQLNSSDFKSTFAAASDDVDDNLGRSILVSKLVNTLVDYSDCVIGFSCEFNGIKNIPIAELQAFPNSVSSSRNLQWLVQDSKYIQASKESDKNLAIKQLIAELALIAGNLRFDSEKLLKTCKIFLDGRVNTFKQPSLFEKIFNAQLNIHLTTIYNNINFILEKFNSLNSIIFDKDKYTPVELPKLNKFAVQLNEVEELLFKWIDILNYSLNEMLLTGFQQSLNAKKPGKYSISQALGFGKGNILFENFYNKFKPILKDYSLCTLSNEFSELLVPQNQILRRPKVPKGTQDFGPKQMRLRSMVIEKIRRIFLEHGAVEIDTPVFELRETLMNKYGEDQKLIFELKDQGGEQLALRYDLTVPFARFISSQQSNKLKRFHIGKVYRRDEPQMTNGRFREFMQCDLDISGEYDSMIPDAEIVFIVCRILQSFSKVTGGFKVKLSHRKLLDSILEISNVPQELRKSISSSIDKLDKESWEAVSNEMIQKGISEESVLSIKNYISINGTISSVLERVEGMDISKLDSGKEAIEDIKLFNKYISSLNMSENLPVHLDLSLARGLDYYTGLVYEAVLVDNANVGSVAAGGRYDGLIGSFTGNSQKIPAIGLSIGIERIYRIIEKKTENLKESATEVYVCSIGDDMIYERMKICNELWNAGIAAEFTYLSNPKIKKQLSMATTSKVPLVVIVGPDEIANNSVIIKQKADSDQGTENWEQINANRSDMIRILKDKIDKAKSDLFP